ncbi:hypothetical protein OC835_001942 [Tilletia horrida]|nr:hypothetical protein OC835_001942 [Tilletia horrida]
MSFRLLIGLHGVLISLLAACLLGAGPSFAASPSANAIRMLPPTSLDWTQFRSASRPPSYLLVQGSYSSQSAASAACAALNERLVDISKALRDPNLVRQLAYLVYESSEKEEEDRTTDARVSQIFWTADSDRVLALSSNSDGTGAQVQPQGAPNASGRTVSVRLPALCTNSAPWKTVNSTDTSPEWRVAVASGTGEYRTTYTGFRDMLGFRFAAVPYAKPPARFAPSTALLTAQAVHAMLGSSFSALRTTRAQQCPQTSGTDKPYTEDGCLVLNIATGFLPPSGQPVPKNELRPILFWIHGGGFSAGSGLDGTFDGTGLSSRNDIVVISPNYRLGTLGWLAVSQTTSPALTGNFGLSDILAALRWVRAHAATFGGDPDRISVMGQSAGAQIVQLLLQSEAAAGLFQSAVVMSGRPWDKADERMTRKVAERPISEGGANGLAVLQSLGCAPAQLGRRHQDGSVPLRHPEDRRASGSDGVLACLRELPTAKFLTSSVFSRPVVDGNLIRASTLDLSPPSSAKAHVNRVPLLLGTMRDELGSLGSVPAPGTSLEQALTQAGINDPQKAAVVANKDGAFPRPTAGRDPVQNLTVTVESEITSILRCGHDSMLNLASDNGVFPIIHAYEYFSRAWQIPNYDPNAACAPESGAELREGHYFLCHSGDLMSVFASPGFMFALEPRDDLDLRWLRSVSDAWAAFARSGGQSPVMDPVYAAVRGYTASRASVAAWKPLRASGTREAGRRRQSSSSSSSSKRVALLGAYGVQDTRALGVGSFARQCSALGFGINYILQQRT